MCGGGGGGGGGGGSVSRVSAPQIPVTPVWQGDPRPPVTVKPTPMFDDDVVEKPRAKPTPPPAKKPSPLSTVVSTVTNFFRGTPAPEAPVAAAKPPVAAKPPPAVRADPPMPEIPVAEPAAPVRAVRAAPV